MTTLGKTVFLILSVAALVAATLAYRGESATTPQRAQLTPAQLAEMQSAPGPAAVKASRPVAADDDDSQPREAAFEDGNGS